MLEDGADKAFASKPLVISFKTPRHFFICLDVLKKRQDSYDDTKRECIILTHSLYRRFSYTYTLKIIFQTLHYLCVFCPLPAGFLQLRLCLFPLHA